MCLHSIINAVDNSKSCHFTQVLYAADLDLWVDAFAFPLLTSGFSQVGFDSVFMLWVLFLVNSQDNLQQCFGPWLTWLSDNFDNHSSSENQFEYRRVSETKRLSLAYVSSEILDRDIKKLRHGTILFVLIQDTAAGVVSVLKCYLLPYQINWVLKYAVMPHIDQKSLRF